MNSHCANDSHSAKELTLDQKREAAVAASRCKNAPTIEPVSAHSQLPLEAGVGHRTMADDRDQADEHDQAEVFADHVG